MKTLAEDPQTQTLRALPPVQTPASQATIPSMINIPPQLAVTVTWIGVGIVIGWLLFRPKSHKQLL